MKKILFFLVGACLLGSVAAKADSFDVKTATTRVKGKRAAARPEHQVVYITNVSVTGSHIPLCVTKYGNEVHSTSSFVAYSQPQLDQTGQLNVGAQLAQRDPAISSTHH